MGKASPLCPGDSDINLFGNRERVVNLDAEIADGAFDLGVAEQELHGSQIPRATLDQLAPVVTEFLLRFPEVSVELLVKDRVVDLLEGEFDVGVRIGRLPSSSSLTARKIAPIRLAVCAAPDYLARHGVPKTPDDLSKHDCLEYTYFESRGEWRLLNEKGDEIVVPVSGRYLANNGDVLRTTAIAGGGIILLPTFIIGEDLRAGRLVRLLPHYPPPEQGLHALYPPGRHPSAKVRSFVDFLVVRFGGEPAWDRG